MSTLVSEREDILEEQFPVRVDLLGLLVLLGKIPVEPDDIFPSVLPKLLSNEDYAKVDKVYLGSYTPTDDAPFYDNEIVTDITKTLALKKIKKFLETL